MRCPRRGQDVVLCLAALGPHARARPGSGPAPGPAAGPGLPGCWPTPGCRVATRNEHNRGQVQQRNSNRRPHARMGRLLSLRSLADTRLSSSRALVNQQQCQHGTSWFPAWKIRHGPCKVHCVERSYFSTKKCGLMFTEDYRNGTNKLSSLCNENPAFKVKSSIKDR